MTLGRSLFLQSANVRIDISFVTNRRVKQRLINNNFHLTGLMKTSKYLYFRIVAMILPALSAKKCRLVHQHTIMLLPEWALETSIKK